MSDFLTGSSLPEGNGERLAAPQDYEGALGAFGPGSEEDNRLQPLTPVGVLSPDPRAAVTAAEQDPFSSLSAHEQAFIAWMKSCSPSANKRRDDWWISLLKVFSSLVSLFSFSLSRSPSFSSLSLSLFLSCLPSCFLQVLQDCDIGSPSDLENVAHGDVAHLQITPGVKGFINTLIKHANEAYNLRNEVPSHTADISAFELGPSSKKQDNKLVCRICYFRSSFMFVSILLLCSGSCRDAAITQELVTAGLVNRELRRLQIGQWACLRDGVADQECTDR